MDLTLEHCRSLSYKLSTVKVQLQVATYTHDNIAALSVLGGHITAALREAQGSFDQVWGRERGWGRRGRWHLLAPLDV